MEHRELDHEAETRSPVTIRFVNFREPKTKGEEEEKGRKMKSFGDRARVGISWCRASDQEKTTPRDSPHDPAG